MGKRRKKNKEREWRRGWIKLHRSVIDLLEDKTLNLTSFGAYVVFLLTAHWPEHIQEERTILGPTKITNRTGLNKSIWSRHYKKLQDLGLLENDEGYVPYFLDFDTLDSNNTQHDGQNTQQPYVFMQQPVAYSQRENEAENEETESIFISFEPTSTENVANMQHQGKPLDTTIETSIKDKREDTVDRPKVGRRKSPQKCKNCDEMLQESDIVWAVIKKDGICSECRKEKERKGNG